MATYRVDSNTLNPLNHSTTYEVVMMADQQGNIISLDSTSPVDISDTNTSTGIDATNSSTTPLANNASFTGEWVDVSNYDSVVVAVSTDQNGYYSVQFSPDGVNQDSSLTRYYRTNRINAPHRFTITRKYSRVVFTNDNAANTTQSYFRLQTMYGSKTPLNVPTDAVIAQDYDATVVRPTHYNNEVALGLRQGATTWNKWGFNPNLTSGDPEATVWAEGGRLVPLTGANTINIRSSSSEDRSFGAFAGNGATSIIIWGLDANNRSVTEVVSMNGTSNVQTTTAYVGINRMSIYASGNTGINQGTITATATTAGTRQGIVPASLGSSQQNFFYVQQSHTAMIDWMWLNANKVGGSSPLVTFKVWVRSLVSGARYEVFRYVMDTGVENHVELRPSQPFVVGEKSLVEVTANTTVNATIVSARFSLIEYRDKAST